MAPRSPTCVGRAEFRAGSRSRTPMRQWDDGSATYGDIARGHAPSFEAAKGELATCWHKWLAWAELSETVKRQPELPHLRHEELPPPSGSCSQSRVGFAGDGPEGGGADRRLV